MFSSAVICYHANKCPTKVVTTSARIMTLVFSATNLAYPTLRSLLIGSPTQPHC